VYEVEISQGDTVTVRATVTRIAGGVLSDASEVEMTIRNVNGTVVATRTLTAGEVTNKGLGVYETSLIIPDPGTYYAIIKARSAANERKGGRVKFDVGNL
jgi:hypothetical protein